MLTFYSLLKERVNTGRADTAEVRAAKNKHLLSLIVLCEFTEDSRPFLLTLRNTSVFNQRLANTELIFK